MTSGDPFGFTELHLAAGSGDDKAVRFLLAGGADVNAPDRRGYTPLHRAARLTDSLKVISSLIEHGAVVNAQGNCGETPLHEAADAGRASVVRILLANGADLNAMDIYGNTPRHRASDSIGSILTHAEKVKSGETNTSRHSGRY